MSEEPKAEAPTGGVLPPEPAPTRRERRAKRDASKKCYHCGQEGHIARDCTNEEAQGEEKEAIMKEKDAYRRCFNCGKNGHISANCDKPAGNKCCYNCGKEGHISRDCTEPAAE